MRRFWEDYDKGAWRTCQVWMMSHVRVDNVTPQQSHTFCSVLFSGSPESQYKTYERYEFDGMVEAFGRLAF